MSLAHDRGIQHAESGTPRIHRRIDAQLHNLPRQQHRGIQCATVVAGAWYVKSSSGMRTDYTEGIEPSCVVVIRPCNDANFVANVVW